MGQCPSTFSVGSPVPEDNAEKCVAAFRLLASLPNVGTPTFRELARGDAPWKPIELEKSMRRDQWIKLRVSSEEKTLFEAKAAEADMTLADLIRTRLLSYRIRQSALERERLLQLARIGANINQIARWVNTYKGGLETVQVVSRLEALLRATHKEP